jgi:nucleolar protein 14
MHPDNMVLKHANMFNYYCSFDGRKRQNVSRVRQERARLSHKVKKETKSAIRELKQDNAFLARTQQKHELQM